MRGVTLGAPGLLWRTRTVLLIGLVICLPVEVLVAFATGGYSVREDVPLLRVLIQALSLPTADMWLWDFVDDAAVVAGTSLVGYALRVWVAAVAVVAAVYACIGLPVGIRSICGSVLTRSGRLAVLVLVGFGLSIVALGAELAAFAMTASMADVGSAGLLLIGLVVVILAGVFLFLVKAVVFLAVPGIVVEDARPLPAIAKMLGLALRRSLPALGTAFAGLIVLTLTRAGADWLFGPGALGAVWHMPDWLALGVSRAVADAVGVPVVAVLFMLRYLDLRLRREGLGRERLQYELQQAASPQPRAG